MAMRIYSQFNTKNIEQNRLIWKKVPFVVAVGDNAIQMATDLPNHIKRKTCVILIHADTNQSELHFKHVKHCFLGVISCSLDSPTKGMGKSSINGENFIAPLLPEVKGRIGKEIDSWKMKYGIEPNLLLELYTSGGTGKGMTLAQKDWAYEILKPEMRFVIHSLSRADSELPTTNSVLELCKNYPEVIYQGLSDLDTSNDEYKNNYGKTVTTAPIFIVYDRQRQSSKKTSAAIIGQITSLVSLSCQGGVKGMDISDCKLMADSHLIGTIDSTIRDMSDLELEILDQDTVYDFTSRIIEETNENHIKILGRSAFNPLLGDKYIFLMLSPVRVSKEAVDAAADRIGTQLTHLKMNNDYPLENQVNSDMEVFPAPGYPLMGNALIFGNHNAIRDFVQNQYLPMAMHNAHSNLREIARTHPKYSKNRALKAILAWYDKGGARA